MGLLLVAAIMVAAMIFRWPISDSPAAFQSVSLIQPTVSQSRAPSIQIDSGPITDAVGDDVDTASTDLIIAEESSGDSDSCLGIEDVQTHPDWIVWKSAVSSVSDSGPDFHSLGEVGEFELLDLARDGDPAAMITLGYRSMLEAFGHDPELAIPLRNARDWEDNEYLKAIASDIQDKLFISSRVDLGLPTSKDRLLHLTDEQRSLIEQAAHWYYQGAVHGRIDALRMYGELISLQHSGPVGIGWLSQEEFDQMDLYGKQLFDPGTVYSDLVFRFWLSDRVHPRRSMVSEDLQGKMHHLVDLMQAKLLADIKETGSSVPDSPLPLRKGAWELLEQSCPGVSEQL